MVDRQEGHVLGIEFDERRERDLLIGDRRLDVELVQRVRVRLQPGRDLENHVVGVQLREVLRHLALPEGVVERLVDDRRLNPEARGLVAVDRQRQHRAVGLLIGCDVLQLRQRLQLRQQFRRPLVQLVEIGILQRVLILRARCSAADIEILRGLEKKRRARHACELGAEPGDDLVRACLALVAWLQSDDDESVVDRPRAADKGGPACHVRILGDHVGELVLQPHQLTDVIAQDPDVAGWATFVGGSRPINNGFVVIGLKPRDQRKASADQIITRLRAKFTSVPGTTFFLQAAQDLNVGGRTSRTQYQYTLQDPDLDELNEWAPKLLAKLQALPQLKDVATDQQTNSSMLSLAIDRDQ